MAQYFSRLKLHSPPFTLSHPGPQQPAEAAEVPRRQHSQEGGLSWEPQHQETWWLGVYCPEGPPALGPTRDSGPSQNTADNRSLKRVNRRAPCQAGWTPPQSSSGTEGCSASRDRIASHIREAGDKTVGTALLSFSSSPGPWRPCRRGPLVSSVQGPPPSEIPNLSAPFPGAWDGSLGGMVWARQLLFEFCP